MFIVISYTNFVQSCLEWAELRQGEVILSIYMTIHSCPGIGRAENDNWSI